MARVLGVGGVFFKSKDPGTLTSWYRDVLGLEVEDWGGAGAWRADSQQSSLGLGLVRILAKQLEGSFSITLGAGARADLSFPMAGIAPAVPE